MLAASHRPLASRRQDTTEGDELMFGDFCFTCGNAIELGGAYCSRECRDSDSLERPYLSPDFSPSVPPLVSSTRGSVSSTPPSSVRSSPSPRNALMADLGVGEEPPPLDLPSLAIKFDYGGASLPIGLRYPSRLGFQQDGTFPSREPKSSSFGDNAFEPLDLTYRRRPGMGKDHIPAPLYYRQTARVHSSPALGPSSPPRATYSPLLFPHRAPSINSVHTIAPFDLPPAVTSAPAALPSTNDCGRPGCTGTTQMAPRMFKRAPAVASSAADLLLSPRIRALRGVDSPEVVEEKEEGHAATEQQHSAFACYLFSQLSETSKRANKDTKEEEGGDYGRGRSSQSSAMVDEKRSMSADSSFPSRPSSLRPARLFLSRGRPPLARLDSNDEVETIKSLALPTPGHLISATTASPSSSIAPSPIPSPPASPPTVSHRGRPGLRRLSSAANFVPVESVPSSIDPRGRSKLRGIGAIQRDYSPARDTSESASRGRESNPSNDRGRIASGSRARGERMERDGSRRSTRDAGSDEEERGRGRRDKSLLRRGRGYEIAISGAAYGHYDSP